MPFSQVFPDLYLFFGQIIPTLFQIGDPKVNMIHSI